MTIPNTIRVDGADLYYEVRGSGPFLLVLGAPMPSHMFGPVADALADHYTVVTLDPRGISKSTLDDPEQDSTPELRADDVAAVMDALGAGTADVFGSSGGAVTGLALVARHPGRVRTLIAHEPPVLELLPDAAEHRANADDLIETFHRDGLFAAMTRFMGNAGFEDSGDGAPQGPPPSDDPEQDMADGARFFGHELRGTTRYVPDIPKLHSGAERVVIGVGVDSGQLLTAQTSAALADQLGPAVVEFPGDHGGFMGDPVGFAARVREVLAPVAAPASQ